MAGNKKFIDDTKMDDFLNKNWKEYQKAQKKKTTGTTKKKVKRK